MNDVDLTVIIPAYNEEKSLPILLKQLLNLKLTFEPSMEIIVIDDASTDRTKSVTLDFINDNLKCYSLEKNSGKGAAVKFGIKCAKGSYLIIQDADLEYSPSDIPIIYKAAKDNNGAVIYGSRVAGAKQLKGLRKVLRLWPRQALSSWLFNFVLTTWVFALHRLIIRDTLTGYKMYQKSLFDNWQPITNGFETDHEITSYIIQQDKKIIEVPISYHPRSKAEGKKIKMSDGISAIKTFWRYR